MKDSVNVSFQNLFKDDFGGTYYVFKCWRQMGLKKITSTLYVTNESEFNSITRKFYKKQDIMIDGKYRSFSEWKLENNY